MEQSERVLRRRREKDGERWAPKIFQWDAAAGTWWGGASSMQLTRSLQAPGFQPLSVLYKVQN